MSQEIGENRSGSSEFDLERAARRFTRLAERSGLSVPPYEVREHRGAIDVPTARGMTPDPSYGDERFVIEGTSGGLVISAYRDVGVFRALTALLRDPDRRGADGPHFAWRGLCLDTVRWACPVELVLDVIDLLALHGLNVLHLHLTDNEGWRLPFPADIASSNAFTRAELDRIIAHARRRYVTLVPEIDLPGHVAPVVRARPHLMGHGPRPHPLVAYLDPDAAETVDFVRAVVTQLVETFPGDYVHLGGDEAFGLSQAKFDRVVAVAVDAARAAGAQVVGWQEAVRSETTYDVLQYWITPADIVSEDDFVAKAPEEYAELARAVARSFAEVKGDPSRLAHAGVPVLVSTQDPLYLDRRDLTESTESRQTERMRQIGFDAYAPAPTAALLDWDPLRELPVGATVAGVEAAVFAESIESRADLSMLLLPRLALYAETAWHGRAPSLTSAMSSVRHTASAWAHLDFPDFYRSTTFFEEQIHD